MIVAIDIVLSVLMITAGYIFVCYYLNGLKWNSKNTEVLKISRNKIFYLTCVSISTIGLVCLFELVYDLSLIQNIKLLFLILLMFPMAAIDLRVHKIPNQLIIAALLVRGLLYIPEFIISSSKAFSVLKDNLLGFVIIGAFFLLLLLVFKNSIGMGDIKLFAVMGFYQGLWGALNSVFFSLAVSFVISIVLLITKKKSRKDTISFGPSILIGTIIAIGLAGM